MTSSQNNQMTTLQRYAEEDAVWFANNKSHMFRFRHLDPTAVENVLAENPQFYDDFKGLPWLLISFRAEDPHAPGSMGIMMFVYPEPDSEDLEVANLPANAPRERVIAATNMGMSMIGAAANAGSEDGMLCLQQMLIAPEVEAPRGIVGSNIFTAIW